MAATGKAAGDRVSVSQLGLKQYCRPMFSQQISSGKCFGAIDSIDIIHILHSQKRKDSLLQMNNTTGCRPSV